MTPPQPMPESQWKGPRHWRWRGYRRWHRWAVGPLCVSFYVYRPGETARRVWVSHSWRYKNITVGEWRHVDTFRQWRLARARRSTR